MCITELHSLTVYVVETMDRHAAFFRLSLRDRCEEQMRNILQIDAKLCTDVRTDSMPGFSLSNQIKFRAGQSGSWRLCK